MTFVNNTVLGLIVGLSMMCSIGAQSVVSLSRSRSIVSGGLQMSVQGSGFSVASNPRAVITMYYESNRGVKFRGEDCTVESGSSLSCSLPGIVPPVGYTLPDVTLGANPLLNDPGVLRFKVGITFTGKITLEEFQDLNIYANPDFSQNDISRTFTVWTYRFIVIVGKHFTKAATMEDYRVSVTDQVCHVQFVNSSYISCDLPLTVPSKDDGNFSTIRVHLGNIVYDVGRIRYRVPVFANGADNLPVFDYDPSDISSRILVNGEAVMVGLTAINYEVRIGQGYATDIRTTPTSLSCRGPSASPLPTSLFTQHPGYYPQLIIKVPKSNKGMFQYEYHVGYLRYINHDYSQGSVITEDTSGPGIVVNRNNGNSANSDNGRSNSNSSENNSNSDGYTLWIVLAFCLALAALLALVICCCFCCPGLCGERRWRYTKEPLNSSTTTGTVIMEERLRTPRTSDHSRSDYSRAYSYSGTYFG